MLAEKEHSLRAYKQSAHCWNTTLDEYLKSVGYCKSNTDGRMYLKSVKEANCHISSVILGVYVDDIIPVSNDPAMLKAEKAALNVRERFKMIDLEDNYLLSSWYINQARKRVKNVDNMST